MHFLNRIEKKAPTRVERSWMVLLVTVVAIAGGAAPVLAQEEG